MESVWIGWWVRRGESTKDVRANSFFVWSKTLYISLRWFIFLLSYIASWQPHTHPCDLFSLSPLPLTFTRLCVLSISSLYLLNTFLTSADCPHKVTRNLYPLNTIFLCIQRTLLKKMKKRKVLKSVAIELRSGHRNESSRGSSKQTV